MIKLQDLMNWDTQKLTNLFGDETITKIARWVVNEE